MTTDQRYVLAFLARWWLPIAVLVGALVVPWYARYVLWAVGLDTLPRLP